MNKKKLIYQTPSTEIDVMDVNSVLCQSMVLPGLEDGEILEWDD